MERVDIAIVGSGPAGISAVLNAEAMRAHLEQTDITVTEELITGIYSKGFEDEVEYLNQQKRKGEMA
ncbi:MAG: hypothetical protein ACLU6W_06550 [Lachnospiraceae bacterium]|nr:hypothetical protein [Candidatus Fimimorpha excrementavium]